MPYETKFISLFLSFFYITFDKLNRLSLGILLSAYWLSEVVTVKPNHAQLEYRGLVYTTQVYNISIDAVGIARFRGQNLFAEPAARY